MELLKSLSADRVDDPQTLAMGSHHDKQMLCELVWSAKGDAARKKRESIVQHTCFLCDEPVSAYKRAPPGSDRVAQKAENMETRKFKEKLVCRRVRQFNVYFELLQ